jgi:hypothetical protein
MAPHPIPSPQPSPPVLTPEQKRRRIERFRKCIERIDALDPQKKGWEMLFWGTAIAILILPG